MTTTDLKGRIAIVTGAGRGIGYAIAERLLRSGASVCIWDIDRDRLTAATAALSSHGDVTHALVDVTDSRAVDEAVGTTAKRSGKLDILVNNAGVLGPRKNSIEHSDAEWQICIDVLLTGTFYCSRAALKAMLPQRSGRIVNIASTSGKEGSAMMPAYSAAKAGVIGLTKAMGREYAETGVLINCITPATTETELVRDLGDEYKKVTLTRIPMARYGQVGEIAAMAAWIASDDCSFTTGGVFDASGGRSTY